MPFTNKIRLPINLGKPQFPVDKTQFRKANGVNVTLSAVIRKTFVLETDNFSEQLHQRLTIALAHDSVFATSEKYVGEITLEEAGQITWPDFKDYPLGKVEHTVQATPFDATNVNCSSCDDLAQIELFDDTFPSPIAADATGTMNVFANDEICCNPITASIVTFNPAYVDSASIDETTGVISIHIKADATDATGAQLATYRVTCPNGGFDEANVFGDIDGVAPPVCDPPTDLEISGISSNAARVDANNLNNAIIVISLCSAPSTPLFTGAFTSPYFIEDHYSLSPDTCYQVAIYNFCDPEQSSTLTDEFTTADAPEEATCGLFSLTLNDFRPNPMPQCSVTYTSCNGSNLTVFVQNHGSAVQICAKTTTPGVPDFLTTNAVFGFHYSYLGPC